MTSDKKNRLTSSDRKGNIIVLSAILMVIMMGFIALSVDAGFMYNVKTEMDRAVDAGALAGASALPAGVMDAEIAARSIVAMNRVANESLSSDHVTFEPGHWDVGNRVFTPDWNSPSAVRVTAEKSDHPLFFAKVWGHDRFATSSSAVALFEPRDIMVVLDYSGSMNDDSELKKIDYNPNDSWIGLPRATVEGNINQIYSEMGSPAFGNGAMAFAPNWMNVPGQTPSNIHRPQIYVEYKYNKAVVRSTKPIYRIRTYKSSSSYNQQSGPGTLVDGYYEKEVTYNNSNRITKVRVWSGYRDSNYSSSNRYREWFYWDSRDNMRASAKKALGLTSFPYPSWAGGSWNSYIDYCADWSNADNYNSNRNAGYRYQFGYLNWVNYILEKKSSYNDSPTLWQCSEQPITAVKNSVDVFLNYMQSMNGGDHIGLAVYNSSSGYGKLEQGLTANFGVISTLSRQRQSNHYHNMTNIAAGIQTARTELVNNARPGVVRRIVLMTDGVANWPNSSTAASEAIQAAHDCADAGIEVATISLGTGADTGLMQEIADITDGIHFNVPGGRPVSEVEADLRETFEWVANARPLRLVSD